MHSVASSSFCVIVVVVAVLFGKVLDSVVFSVNKKTKAPSTCQRGPPDVSLSSLKCEMSVTSLVTGVYSVTGIRTLAADFSYQPTKSISPVCMGW